jgi:hypothetical protein
MYLTMATFMSAVVRWTDVITSLPDLLSYPTQKIPM